MSNALSNKTLVMMLLVTMVVSVFGTFMSLNRIDGLMGFTGAWAGLNANSTYGSVNLTISSLLRINFTIDNVSFGSGFVAAGQAACVLSTGETSADSRCSGWNSPGGVHGLLLENIGNELAAINISNANYSDSLFGDTSSKYAWKFDALNNSDGSGNDNANVTCNDTSRAVHLHAAFRTFLNLTTGSYPGANGTSIGSRICNPLNNSAGDRGINITFKLQIDSTTGARAMEDLWFAYAKAI